MILKNFSNLIDYGAVELFFEDATSYELFDNITQSYGICFTKDGTVPIVRSDSIKYTSWLLPGGTVEDGETPEGALHREVMEEADIILENVNLLGGQKVHYLDVNKSSHYQLRFVCLIKEIQSQTIDPDYNSILERKFVKIEELNDYLQWGPIGDHLVMRAKEWFEKQKLN